MLIEIGWGLSEMSHRARPVYLGYHNFCRFFDLLNISKVSIEGTSMDNFLIRKAQVDDLPIIQDVAIVANMLLTRFVIGFPKYCRLQSRGCLVKTYSLTSKKEERKVNKILSLVMALFVVSLLGKPVQAIGQEWSTEQKELWETNKTRWELWKKAEDPEAFKA